MTTEYENESAIQYRRRRRRPSVWKDGREYIWNDKYNDYVCWVKKKGTKRSVPMLLRREIARARSERAKILNEIKVLESERDRILQFAQANNDERCFAIGKDIQRYIDDLCSLIGAFPKPPKRELKNAPAIRSDEDFIGRLELARRKSVSNDSSFGSFLALGSEQAQKANAKVQKLADDLSRVVLLEKKIERLEMHELRLTKTQGYKAAKTFRETIADPYKNELIDLNEYVQRRLLDYGRNGEEANAIIAYLFQDRGGTEFFSDQYQNEVVETFKKIGRENIAKKVLWFYNTIARAYNLRGRIINPPKVFFDNDLDLNEKGVYDGKNVRLSPCLSAFELLETFVHELGHWLEEKIFGDEAIQMNCRWLMTEQNSSPVEKRVNGSLGNFVPDDRQPNLCFDEYSYRVYPDEKRKGRFEGDELITTGMQRLLTVPELFVRRCPKHFNLLIKNLTEALDERK